MFIEVTEIKENGFRKVALNLISITCIQPIQKGATIHVGSNMIIKVKETLSEISAMMPEHLIFKKEPDAPY